MFPKTLPTVILVIIALASQSVFQPIANAGEGITFADVRACAQCVGDFAEVLPVVQYAYLGAQKAGLVADEEKEFRDKLEAQNKQILSGISSLNQGLQRVEVSLDEIKAELAAVRKEVAEIPDRTRSTELYVDAYTFLKRVVRVKDPQKGDLEKLRNDLQTLIDDAEGAASICDADLRFYSACSILCISAKKCYDAELLVASGGKVTGDITDYFDQTAESLDKLLSHSEATFDLLEKREQLTAEYDASVRQLVAKSSKLGFSWSADRSACTIGIRCTKQPESTGTRIVLFRTEKKPTPKAVITEAAFKPSDPVSESVKGTIDPEKHLVSIFRSLSTEDFDAFSADEVAQQQAKGTLTFADYDASEDVQTRLKGAVEVYNAAAEDCRRLAFQVTLADGLAKWLADSKQLTTSMKSAKK